MDWHLNVNQFTFFDKIKICKFILNAKNRWTQDNQVKLFEKEMANIIGAKYAVFLSSGSTANTLLAQYIKDSSKNFDEKKIIVLPSTTWQTSCSPWIREGFIPKFIDISLDNFCIDKNKLLKYIKEYHQKIACVFPTSLIGFVQDIDFYQSLENKYGIKICFDNCENTLGDFKKKNISSYFTSTTSTYFGHQIQSVEGGFIFTNSEKEYDYFLMNRNHGMVRSLGVYGRDLDKYNNKKVDPLFDFYSLGNNFRNSDIHALIGRLDLKRFQKYKKARRELYKLFKNQLDLNKFYLPNEKNIEEENVPFCLPIIVKNKNLNLINKCKDLCRSSRIEYRPIISGFLGYQTCYKEFFENEKKYKNSVYIHKYGFYVGLHSKIKKEDILYLTSALNAL